MLWVRGRSQKRWCTGRPATSMPLCSDKSSEFKTESARHLTVLMGCKYASTRAYRFLEAARASMCQSLAWNRINLWHAPARSTSQARVAEVIDRNCLPCVRPLILFVLLAPHWQLCCASVQPDEVCSGIPGPCRLRADHAQAPCLQVCCDLLYAVPASPASCSSSNKNLAANHLASLHTVPAQTGSFTHSSQQHDATEQCLGRTAMA